MYTSQVRIDSTSGDRWNGWVPAWIVPVSYHVAIERKMR
jgi:hypothetical protein